MSQTTQDWPDPWGKALELRARTWLTTEWTSLADPCATGLLGIGWGQPQSWGVWGVGAEHELIIATDVPLGDKAVVEADVHAPLDGSVREQGVTVSVDNHVLALWRFSHDWNRGVRLVSIPRLFLSRGVIHLLLRPVIGVALRLGGPGDDEMPLGVGLRRIRWAHTSQMSDRMGPVTNGFVP